MTGKATASKPVPKPSDLMLATPLYEAFPIPSHQDAQAVWNIEYFQSNIDSFCIDCKKHSIFERENFRQLTYTAAHNLELPIDSLAGAIARFGDGYPRSPRIIYLQLKCTRNADHKMRFLFEIRNGRLIKTGQYPSLADLSQDDLRPYSKVLSEEKHRELVRAVGLVSHGVGIGAFVYLRRVFEDLIEEAHQRATGSTGWNETEYQEKRIAEKIQALKDFLPPFLVENKTVYGVLSKGVHSLAEDECLRFFEPIKIGIILMLDQKLEQAEKQQKEDRARKAIASITQELNTPKPAEQGTGG